MSKDVSQPGIEPLDAADVTICPLEQHCEACDSPASRVVFVNLRAIGQSVSVGQYCVGCAGRIATRLKTWTGGTDDVSYLIQRCITVASRLLAQGTPPSQIDQILQPIIHEQMERASEAKQ